MNKQLMIDLAKFIEMNGADATSKLISDSITTALTSFGKMSHANCHKTIGKNLIAVAEELLR